MARLDEVNVWTLLQLEAAVSNKALDGFMEYVRGHFGLAGAVYICPSFPGRSLADPFLATADRTAWADRYVAFDYAALDPTLSVSARSVHPVDWVRRPLWKEKVRPIMRDEGADGRHGMTFPVRGPTDDLRAVFIVTSNESHAGWYGRRQELKKELAIVANYVHQRAYQLHGEAPIEVDSVTRREIEALEWAAEGKSVEDTAMTMRLPAAAVWAHLESARHKLQAVNRAHAVTKAIQKGLIC
jgi:LuxR family transcriptional regulator, quorum-sensing system regulator SinR